MSGARTALGGPSADLLLAYRGTAYLLHWVSLLPEHAYDEPGAGDAALDRRRTLARVGYDARGWANLVEGCRTGAAEPRSFPPGERDRLIEDGRTLPPRALRHLVEHSAVHLAVEWRDLPAADWTRSGIDDRGEPIPVAETPWRRALQVWTAAVDLGTGAAYSDFPDAVIDRLLTEGGARIDQDDPARAWAVVDGAQIHGTRAEIARTLWRRTTDDAAAGA